jgi:hypothetical protein
MGNLFFEGKPGEQTWRTLRSLLIFPFWFSRVMIMGISKMGWGDDDCVVNAWRLAVLWAGFLEDVISLVSQRHEKHIRRKLSIWELGWGLLGAHMCIIPQFTSLFSEWATFCWLTDWKIQATGFGLVLAVRLG